MTIGFFTVTEWIALVGFISGLFFSFAKLYSTLQSILKQLKDLNANFDESKSDRKILHQELNRLRLDFTKQKTSVDEQFKTAFKNIAEIARRIERGNDI
ncbi:hypothetical protein IW492_02620 [Enterococcus sp. BWB1-3]|uniref:hypothetical protein n=1 Tax=Enterococcus sp. BWB1-3 TaxID=2787713 RepID=UPI001920F46C|nr:hypothetical protein [Enterococcus sp. BWB1-3]MBL1228125.1 hypothetical protein [Enterococcus sp. BWB1-3]